MGRELVIKKIKKTAIIQIIVCVIMMALLGFLTFIMFTLEEPEAAIVMGAFTLLFLILMCIWIYRFVNPLKDRFMKKNPKLLEQADELFNDIVYKDKNIICSHRLIANAKDIRQIAALDEITNVCENKYSVNFIRTTHDITLTLPNYTVVINVYGQKKQNVQKLKYNIIQHCPKVLENQFKFGARIE
ncbi:MAG: hypothetical protein PUC65_03955 [Clostridiales bacterium]|nr:hypothetical protein [Clostridiales bacterium]